MPEESHDPSGVGPSDGSLLKRAGLGDREAFGAFYSRHRDWMLTYAYSLARDWPDAEEAVQEVFCRLVDGIGRLSIRSSARAYLATSIRNEITSRQSRRFRQEARSQEHSLQEQGEADSGGQELDLSELPDEQREVVVLWALGLTHRQISAALGVPLGTVKARARAAQESLWRAHTEDSKKSE